MGLYPEIRFEHGLRRFNQARSLELKRNFPKGSMRILKPSLHLHEADVFRLELLLDKKRVSLARLLEEYIAKAIDRAVR